MEIVRVTGVDTNIISEFMKGEGVPPQGELFVPFAVIAELRYGVEISSNPSRLTKKLERFLESKDVHMSSGLHTEVITAYVEISAYLKKKGTPVSPNDMWIAAECLALDLPLMTRDSDFEKIPQIRVMSIW